MEREEFIKECVYHAPLLLLKLPKDYLDEVNQYLPYSTGFEIECDGTNETIIKESFKNIPDIVEIRLDIYEQRFRIPNGVRGLICLYNISQSLKQHFKLNEGSGIHYHVDFSSTGIPMSKYYDRVSRHSGYILKELDKWGYTGVYNAKKVSSERAWVRTHTGKNTIEFRIGEMTFDYEILVKRIIHVNEIVKTIRVEENLKYEDEFEPINKEKILKYLKTLKSTATSKTIELTKIYDSLQIDDNIKINRKTSKSLSEIRDIIARRNIRI